RAARRAPWSSPPRRAHRARPRAPGRLARPRPRVVRRPVPRASCGHAGPRRTAPRPAATPRAPPAPRARAPPPRPWDGPPRRARGAGTRAREGPRPGRPPRPARLRRREHGRLRRGRETAHLVERADDVVLHGLGPRARLAPGLREVLGRDDEHPGPCRGVTGP